MLVLCSTCCLFIHAKILQVFRFFSYISTYPKKKFAFRSFNCISSYPRRKLALNLFCPVDVLGCLFIQRYLIVLS
jgi:hypothetical protein